MKLYFASGACSFAPHVVLQELGVAYDLARVNNRSKRTSDGVDFLAVNPKGYIAALQLDNGEVLTEGPTLLQYLGDLKPDLGLAPEGGLPRLRSQEWLSFITSEIHAGSGPLFNKALPAKAQEFLKDRLFRRFDFLGLHLAAQPYLMGQCFTVSDAYLFTVLEWMDGFDINLNRWPSLAEFMARIATRPSVAAARVREAEIPPVL